MSADNVNIKEYKINASNFSLDRLEEAYPEIMDKALGAWRVRFYMKKTNI